MSEIKIYSPLIKAKGFDPSPVATYGIPAFADSIANPKCIGTVAHEDWWNEQIHRCVFGYDTGGIHITGRHYYFLNFSQLLTLERGYHYPDYVDSDYGFFTTVDIAKKEHKGIIVPKKRRYGVSHIMASIFSHGVRFHEAGYKAAIIAGLAEYSDDFYEKFKDDNYRKPPELRIHTIYNNQDNWQAGYEISATKQKDGSFNEVFALTANANENVVKGKILNDCAFEESGEFKNIIATYGATKGCFMRNMTMVGTPYVFGTGGRMKNSSGFKEMVDRCDDYDLIPFDIFGPRKLGPFYFGGVFFDDDNNRVEASCPNLKDMVEGLSEEQYLGCEDVLAATDYILKKGDKLKTANNKQPYYDHIQTSPLNRREIFLNFSGNPFDPDLLSHQAQEIATQPYNRYQRYVLSWVVDDKRVMLSPRQVKREKAPDHFEDWQCVLMSEDVVPGYKDLDVAGIDSYDQDKSGTSKSLGAMCVMRRKDLKTGKSCRKPICIVRMRPKQKEIFYETCLMVAFYYNLKKNVLIDFAKHAIIPYFEQNEGVKFLAERPKSFEGPRSEQSHKWGMLFTTKSKPESIGLAQNWVFNDIQDCWYSEIIREFSDYNVGLTGEDSDWDLADAVILALCRIQDMGHKRPPQHSEDDAKGNVADLPVWVNGKMMGATADNGKKTWVNDGVDSPEGVGGGGFSLVEFG